MSIFKDQGALLFCIILPLAYPIIYSWIYNNEVVRDVPVAVVDMSRSSLSREFIQKVDASPDVAVSLYCNSLEDARSAVGHGEVYGIVFFPEDFATKTGRLEQTHVSVYCDMSYMLTYKAIFQTCSSVSQVLGAKVKAPLSGAYTTREAEIAAKPLDFEEVPIFNTTGGYGNFVLPAVLVLIIQQALLLAVGILAGTDREKKWSSVNGVFSAYIGKVMAYFMVFFVMSAYVMLVVPELFGFVSMIKFDDWLHLVIPYVLASCFFSICISAFVRYRENIMLIVVFTSVPLLFLTGVSWPQFNLPGSFQGYGWVFPSTFAVRAFVRMNSMGAELLDCAKEIHYLWMQVLIYGAVALYVIYRRKVIGERIRSNEEQ